MAAIYDKYYKTINKTCYTANIAYLVLHVIYLILFLIAKLYILVFVDAAVISIYGLFFILLKKKKYYLYALLCGNEYFAFISVTTIMLGFGTGFHFYLIGLCVVSFFTTYFSRDKNPKKSVIWVGLSLAIYLTLYFITKFNAPYYTIDEWLEATLFTIHAVLVFVFVASYLVVFLHYALSLEKKIMNESRTDELTKINNRYGLYDYFDQEIINSNKVLALFDIDDFKKVNDVYGHVTGDIILKRVAEITSSVLKDAFVCRYGGEEFVVVLNEEGDVPFFDRLELLRETVAKEIFTDEGKKFYVTITTGAVKYNEGISLEEWVELADEKMYSGKNSGKNKTVI